MVKGTSRRVIVVDSPDQKLFEQAIFIVRNDAFSQDGVTPQQVLAYRPGIFSDLKGAHVCRQSDKSTFVKGDFT